MAFLQIPWRLYYPIVSISARPDSYAVTRKSQEWFPATRTTTSVSYSTIKNVENRIQKDLADIEGRLRFIERNLATAYGRNIKQRDADILRGASSYNRVGLTFNGKTYLTLYQEYATVLAAAQFTVTIFKQYQMKN